LELASRLAHTLAGVAGNLGANDLALLAKDLELGIRRDGSDVAAPLLDCVESQLLELLSALSEIDEVERSQTGTAAVDWGQVQDTLVELRDSLGNYDARARVFVSDLSGQLTNDVFAQPLKSIEVVVDNYDFASALDHLVELEALVRHHVES
jgi:two-component system sensor histidine kinase/response regulator